MYSAEDPAFSGRLTQIEELKYGKRFPGIGAQVMGADDGYLCQYTQDTSVFWGSELYDYLTFLLFLCYIFMRVNNGSYEV